MKKSLIIFCCLSFSYVLNAQKIHTIQEILKIIEESALTYSISSSDKDLQAPNYAENLLSNDLYRVVEDGHFGVKHYKLSDNAQSYFDEAEEFFQKKDFFNARKKYEMVLKLSPTYYKAIVYIGDTYFQERDFKNAAIWYGRAIDSNYIDYLAHWAMANTSFYLGDKEKALEEISIAKVLNRNNPRLTSKVIELYKLNKIPYSDWYLTPQYAISERFDTKREKDVVDVSYQGLWLPYALVKAVWAYEPDYAKEMGDDPVGITKEKEAIGAILLTMDKKIAKGNPALKTLQYAVEEGSYELYVIYERILVEHPEVALFFEQEDIQSLAHYIMNIRSKCKK